MSQIKSGDAGMIERRLLEDLGGWLWVFGICIGTVVLQGLLLIIHRSGKSGTTKGQPSGTEICLGISIIWTVQLGFGYTLKGLRAILSVGLFEFAANGQLRGHGLGVGWLWDTIASLFKGVLTTWYLHLGLIFILDTGIPYWREIRQNPQKTLRKMVLRSREILNFLQATFKDPFSGFSNDKSGEISEKIFTRKSQAMCLLRRQTDHPNEGQRRLSWNIVVDKDAMDEMKETLGPPGGFGELGFNVARDGVRFEAMGVGTSFNLMFKLKEHEGMGKPQRKMRGKQE